MHFLLFLAIHEVVHVLHAHELCPAVLLGNHIHLEELPRVHGAGTNVEHLARAHEIVERLHLLFHGRVVVQTVRHVEVDVIRAQALEARVYLAEERLAIDALSVGALVHGVVALGGNNRVVTNTHLCNDLAQDLFASTTAVVVCGVVEVDALVPGVADDLACVVLAKAHVDTTVTGLAKPHASKTDATHVEASIAKSCVLHRGSSLFY